MSQTHKLSPELVSLVHHIELNKSGWWDFAVRRLVLTAFWANRSVVAIRKDEVKATLQEQFGVPVERTLIEKNLKALLSEGHLLELEDGRLKLTEGTLADCERQLKEAAELDDSVKNRFFEKLAICCPLINRDEVWLAFSDRFLMPTVSELGANTYRLITGSAIAVDLPMLQVFLDTFPSDETVGLRKFVRSFLDPTDSSVRRYVLRAINAYFVVRASGLNEETILRLSKSASHQPAMVLFIDTNVLFSLLGLHKNPADEGSLALLELVKKLSASVPIKLRVLLPTLDEMKRAITASQESVINMRISPSLLDTAAAVGISGITEKFLRLSVGRGTSISPADYFEPYLKNLLTILRGNGVELFSQDLKAYKTRQDVIDDLLEQQQFEAQRFGPRAKNYERLEHDLMIWHFVKDKRPLRPESPIDAEYWIVTADYRFLGFDSHMQRKMGTEMPICLHPISLTQLLQFWVPQTPEFEQALLSAMRLPSVLPVVDGEAERASLKILNALSTFENIGNLPPETATRILLNDALRQKLTVEDDITKQVELVREALVEENKKAEQRLLDERQKASRLQQDGEVLHAELISKAQEAEMLRGEVMKQTAHASRSRLAAEMTERKLAAYLKMKEKTDARLRFALLWGGVAVALVAFEVYCITRFVAHRKAEITLSLLTVLVFSRLLKHNGQKSDAIRDWMPFIKFNRFHIWIYGSLITGALGSALWDLAKSVFAS